MASSAISLALTYTRLENALEHLPVSVTTEYTEGQMIYDPDHPSNGIYLVINGKVEVSQISETGKELVLEIVRPDELFGESAFIDVSWRIEQAKAFEKTTVMKWAIADIEDMVLNRPRLAVALMQILARRNVELIRRIESSSTESVARQLGRALIRFSERLGTLGEDGSLRMAPLTHDLLSRYVGTSRAIITQHMNQFRRRGYVSYSRRGIVLHREAMEASIDQLPRRTASRPEGRAQGAAALCVAETANAPTQYGGAQCEA